MDARRALGRRRVKALSQSQLDVQAAPTEAEEDREYERCLQAEALVAAFEDLRGDVDPVNYRVAEMAWIDGRKLAAIMSELDLTRDQVKYRRGKMGTSLARRMVFYAGSTPTAHLERSLACLK